MSLENNQELHNEIISAMGNNAASNDPQQMKMNMNNNLIKAAEHLAAGRQLGLEDDVTLQLVARKYRRNL